MNGLPEGDEESVKKFTAMVDKQLDRRVATLIAFLMANAVYAWLVMLGMGCAHHEVSPHIPAIGYLGTYFMVAAVWVLVKLAW